MVFELKQAYAKSIISNANQFIKDYGLENMPLAHWISLLVGMLKFNIDGVAGNQCATPTIVRDTSGSLI